MNEYKDKIHNYVKNHKEEIISTLKELVIIPSVRGEAEKNAPFGKACKEVLEYTEKLYRENGFETELNSEGGYLISRYGRGRKSLGLFAHADVVPVGDDWECTKPFESIEKDGFLIGRGVLDDKSAVVISLYCAKMLKELDISFNSQLVCFTGANEESGMQDIINYVKKYKAPDFSLICDTAFPLYRGNKGMLQFTAACNLPLAAIKDMSASNVRGAIVAKAKIKLDYTDDLYSVLKSYENENVAVSVENEEIIIETYGISKHTALPEGSVNAGYLACEVLKKCNLLTGNDLNQIEFMSELLSHYYGEAVGIENSDPDFGKLTFANDLISLERGKIKLHFNLRFGASVDITALKGKIKEEFLSKGWDAIFEIENTAHITDINHPMIQACLTAYKEFTGDATPTVYVNAGGTYARYLPCAAEIGTTLKWENPKGLPTGHGAAHQPDECISIDGMLEALKLTLQMLLECDKTPALID